MTTAPSKHGVDAIPGDLLLTSIGGVDLREIVEVDEGQGPVNVCCRIICHDLVLTDRHVKRLDADKRDSKDSVQDSSNEDGLIAVDLALAVLFLAVGMGNEGTHTTIEGSADREAHDTHG